MDDATMCLEGMQRKKEEIDTLIIVSWLIAYGAGVLVGWFPLD